MWYTSTITYTYLAHSPFPYLVLFMMDMFLSVIERFCVVVVNLHCCSYLLELACYTCSFVFVSKFFVHANSICLAAIP